MGPIVGGFLYDYSFEKYKYITPFCFNLVLCLILFLMSYKFFPYDTPENLND